MNKIEFDVTVDADLDITPFVAATGSPMLIVIHADEYHSERTSGGVLGAVEKNIDEAFIVFYFNGGYKVRFELDYADKVTFNIF